MPAVNVPNFPKSLQRFPVITIVGMGMVMYPAMAVVHEVGADDEQNGEGQQPKLVFVPNLLGQQQGYTAAKNRERQQGMVVFFIAMPQGTGANGKGQEYHKILKSFIINDIYTQHGQAGKNEGQNGAMNGTGQ
jgi:hypothetical protein